MSLRTLGRHAWLVALVTTFAVLGAMFVTNSTRASYQARGTYVIGPSDRLVEPESIVRSFDSLQGQGIVPTLVELLSSERNAAEVGTQIGLDRRQLEQYDVRANILSSSNTLELTVVGPNPEGAARLASGIGTRASKLFEDLYSVYQIVPLDEPTAPEDPISPDPVRNLVLGALLGLTAGIGLALLRARYSAAQLTTGSPPNSTSRSSDAVGGPSQIDGTSKATAAPRRQMRPSRTT